MQAILAGEIDAKTWVAKNPKKHPNYIGSSTNNRGGDYAAITTTTTTTKENATGKDSAATASNQTGRSAKVPDTPRGGQYSNNPSPRLEKVTATVSANYGGVESAQQHPSRVSAASNNANASNGKFNIHALTHLQDPSFKEGLDAVAFSAVSRAIVDDVQSFIDRKIHDIENHNRSLVTDENIEVARFQVYNQAFSKLISEFHVFRPILSGIKVEYDSYVYKLQERLKKSENSKKSQFIDEEKDKLLLNIETKKSYENEIVQLREEIKSLQYQLLVSDKNIKASWEKEARMKTEYDEMARENTEVRQSMLSLSNALQRYESEKKVLVERDHGQKSELITLRLNYAKAADEAEKMRSMLQEAEELQSTMVSIDVIMKKQARNRFLESEMAYYVELNKRILQRYSVLKSIIDGISHPDPSQASQDLKKDSNHHNSISSNPLVKPSTHLNERVGRVEIDFEEVQNKAISIIKARETSSTKSSLSKNNSSANSKGDKMITLGDVGKGTTILSRQIIEELVDIIEDLQNQIREGILVDNFESRIRTSVHSHLTGEDTFIPHFGNIMLPQDGQAWGNTESEIPTTSAFSLSGPEIPDPNFVVPPLESPFRNFVGLGYGSSVKKVLNPNLPTIATNNATESLPPFLQTNGQIQNLFLSKRELLAELRDIWFVRLYVTRMMGQQQQQRHHAPSHAPATIPLTAAPEQRPLTGSIDLAAAGGAAGGLGLESHSSSSLSHPPPSRLSILLAHDERPMTGMSEIQKPTTAISKFKKNAYVKLAESIYSETVKNLSFADFVTVYFQQKYKNRAVELAYNIFYALHNFSNVSDCFIFMLVYRGDVSEDLFLDIHKVTLKLHQALQKSSPTEITIPCELCLKICTRIMPNKAEVTIAKVSKALTIEARGDRVINYYEMLNDDFNIFKDIFDPSEEGSADTFDKFTNLNHLNVVLKEPELNCKERSLFLEIFRYQFIVDYLVFANMLIDAFTKLRPMANAMHRTNSTISSNSGTSGGNNSRDPKLASTTTTATNGVVEPILPAEPSVSLKVLRETVQKIDPFKSRADINTLLSDGSGLSVDDLLLFEANNREVPIDPFIKRLKKCLIKRSHLQN